MRLPRSHLVWEDTHIFQDNLICPPPHRFESYGERETSPHTRRAPFPLPRPLYSTRVAHTSRVATRGVAGKTRTRPTQWRPWQSARRGVGRRGRRPLSNTQKEVVKYARNGCHICKKKLPNAHRKNIKCAHETGCQPRRAIFDPSRRKSRPVGKEFSTARESLALRA